MIEVAGDLVCETSRTRIHVSATGSALVARVDGLAGVLGILRSMRTNAALVRSIVPLLVRAGIRVDVFVGSVRIARAGRSIDANRLARILALPNVRLGR